MLHEMYQAFERSWQEKGARVQGDVLGFWNLLSPIVRMYMDVKIVIFLLFLEGDITLKVSVVNVIYSCVTMTVREKNLCIVRYDTLHIWCT